MFLETFAFYLPSTSLILTPFFDAFLLREQNQRWLVDIPPVVIFRRNPLGTNFSVDPNDGGSSLTFSSVCKSH